MSSRKVSLEKKDEGVMPFGGRGLIAKILAAEVDPLTHPLGEDNKLILAPGVFAETTIPCTSRLSIGTKSPATGTIRESNVGGPAAEKLGRLGIAAIIIEGTLTDGPSILKIGFGGTTDIEAAYDLKGKGNYDTAQTLRQRFGSNATILSIGPAGELLLQAATIAATDQDGLPARHAGRGGLGAVMGSKGLKAIVLEDDTGERVAPCNRELLTESIKEFSAMILKMNKANKQYGTAWLVNFINKCNGLPTRNFSRGTFDRADKISGERIAELIAERGGKTGHACSRGCIIHCSNVFNDSGGNYVTSGLEYETVGMMGANLEIDDIDAIARLDRLCGDIGVDTIEIGATMGVLMESKVLPFGDSAGVIALLEEIPRGTPLGRLIGSGCEIAGRAFGCVRVPAVKGMAMPSYDPRALHGMGVTVATSPMGPDHTAGPVFSGVGGLDATKPAGQIKLSSSIQITCALLDNFGLCLYTSPVPKTIEFIGKAMKALYDRDMSRDDLLILGEEIVKTEHDFNERAGLTPAADDLPAFFRNEPLPEIDTVFGVSPDELQSVRRNFLQSKE